MQEVSPYAALMTGPTTVANLFGHMGGRSKGLVQIWDVVGFDEVADLEKMPKEVITTMKTYCESGQYPARSGGGDRRGQHRDVRQHQPADRRHGPDGPPVRADAAVIRDDMAFIDRLHFYLPGWEIPKMRNDLFTDHYGFVVDYLAEALRELRRHNFTEMTDRHFAMGSHLVSRDRKAVQEDRVGSDEDHLPARAGDTRGDRGTARIRDGGASAGEGAAQEDGLLRVLPDLLQLHGHRNRRGALRRRARAGRPQPDLRRSLGARKRLHRDASLATDRWHVPGRGVVVGGLRTSSGRPAAYPA